MHAMLFQWCRQRLEIVVEILGQFARRQLLGDGREAGHVGRQTGAVHDLVDLCGIEPVLGQIACDIVRQVVVDRITDALAAPALQQVLAEQADEQRQRGLHQQRRGDRHQDRRPVECLLGRKPVGGSQQKRDRHARVAPAAHRPTGR